MMRPAFVVLSCLAVGLAACDGPAAAPGGDAGPAPQDEAVAAAGASESSAPPADYGPDAVSLDPAALHALLVSSEDEIIPADWRTGEPAPETALAYWQIPALDVEAERTSSCTPIEAEADAYACVLAFTVTEDDRPITARFHLSVRQDGNDDFSLISPAVRWAIQG
ncbi:MAG: hypothetical protein ACLFQ5_04165 [Oceanicaulis sp.]